MNCFSFCNARRFDDEKFSTFLISLHDIYKTRQIFTTDTSIFKFFDIFFSQTSSVYIDLPNIVYDELCFYIGIVSVESGKKTIEKLCFSAS